MVGGIKKFQEEGFHGLLGGGQRSIRPLGSGLDVGRLFEADPDGIHNVLRFDFCKCVEAAEAAFDERHRSPASMGGVNTQSLHINLDGGLDERFARATAAGATVLREPADQFYGDRSCMVTDPEGHVWSFSQTIKTMSFDEMAKAGGVQVRARL